MVRPWPSTQHISRNNKNVQVNQELSEARRSHKMATNKGHTIPQHEYAMALVYGLGMKQVFLKLPNMQSCRCLAHSLLKAYALFSNHNLLLQHTSSIFTTDLTWHSKNATLRREQRRRRQTCSTRQFIKGVVFPIPQNDNLTGLQST